MLGGIAGARQLAGVFAEVHLRKRGIKKWRHWKALPARAGTPRGRLWRDGEEDEAVVMRRRGLSDKYIAATLARTPRSIIGKIGYQQSVRQGAAK